MSFDLTKYMADRWASATKELQRSHARACNTVIGFEALKVAGYDAGDLSEWYVQYPTFSIKEVKDFQSVHKALGKLENAGSSPVGDGRTRMVEVTLRPKDEKFKHFTFYFRKQLPKGKAAKCRIVTVTRREKVLVCEK